MRSMFSKPCSAMHALRWAAAGGAVAMLMGLSGVAYGDATTCDRDASGVETFTTIWEEPRPWSAALAGLPAGPYAPRATVDFVSLNSPPEGDLPRELAITPDGTTALVVNMGTRFDLPGTVTFINIATRTVVATVEVGVLPVQVAISPDGQRAAVANVFGNSVSILDVPGRALLATIPVTGTQPFRCAIGADNRYVVTGVTNDAINSAFSIIDLTTLSEIASHPSASQGSIGFYGTPEFAISGPLHSQFALTPDGTKIVLPVGASTTSSVRIYDRASGAQLANIPIAYGLARSIDISRDGSTAVIGHEASASAVSVIDLNTLALTVSHPVATTLQGQVIRITPDRSHAIAGISNNAIFVDLATGVTDATISTGIVGDIEFTASGQFAFISNFNSSVIDVASRTLVRTLTLAACTEAAASPVGNTILALNSRFREDVHYYHVTGASSTVLGRSLSGAPPEGDCSKYLAATPDGNTLVVGNPISKNVSIVDVATRSVRAWVDTGDRVLDVAVTPDGRYAVVCNGDEDTVSIVDLQTNARVANLSVVSRPARVKISPDGTRAYVLTVAGADSIHFINLNGAASSVIGTAIAGQTGSANGYAYTDVSGIELSPDGSLLAVCRSFDDLVRLINTSTRAIVADVPTGDFPMRIAFSASGTKAWVTNAFSDDVSVLNIAGAGSSLITTIGTGTIDFPFEAVVDPTGQYVYVNNQGNSPRITVIDAATNAILTSVTLNGGNPRDMAIESDGTLHVVGADTAGGKHYRLTSSGGPATTIAETNVLSGSPFSIEWVPSRGLAITSQPAPDGVDFIGPPRCIADVDDGSGTGTPDGGVTIDDLLYYLTIFEAGVIDADVDDGSGTGTPDGGVTIDDLLYFLTRFEGGC
jgi:YVTN family beta-propeller protein